MLKLACDADRCTQLLGRIPRRQAIQNDRKRPLAEGHDQGDETVTFDSSFQRARDVEQRRNRGLANGPQDLAGSEVRRLEPARSAVDHVLEALTPDERAQEALRELARAMLRLPVRVAGQADEHREDLVRAPSPQARSAACSVRRQV
jgi:hypothetical protein